MTQLVEFLPKTPHLGETRAARWLEALAARLELYGRYVRAGREIERLSMLSDAELAARNLRREDMPRRMLAEHGVRLGD